MKEGKPSREAWREFHPRCTGERTACLDGWVSENRIAAGLEASMPALRGAASSKAANACRSAAMRRRICARWGSIAGEMHPDQHKNHPVRGSDADAPDRLSSQIGC